MTWKLAHLAVSTAEQQRVDPHQLIAPLELQFPVNVLLLHMLCEERILSADYCQHEAAYSRRLD